MVELKHYRPSLWSPTSDHLIEFCDKTAVNPMFMHACTSDKSVKFLQFYVRDTDIKTSLSRAQMPKWLCPYSPMASSHTSCWFSKEGGQKVSCKVGGGP